MDMDVLGEEGGREGAAEVRAGWSLQHFPGCYSGQLFIYSEAGMQLSIWQFNIYCKCMSLILQTSEQLPQDPLPLPPPLISTE